MSFDIDKKEDFKMKKKATDDIGVFNIVLIGENPHAVSIADNIRERFSGGMSNSMKFNIVDDIESDGLKSNSWFNEFIYNLTLLSGFNNIVISKGFKDWIISQTYKKPMERVYMKLLLQAMNFIVIDISNDCEADECTFDYDIPQYNFNTERDFLDDMMKWIDERIGDLNKSIDKIRLVRSLSSRNLPYLGDVFGCLSGKKYKNIIKADGMRFDVPILFDEFCFRTRGKSIEEIENSILTRSSSAMASFFK